MDITEFWNLIEAARADAAAASGERADDFASVLADRLAATSKETIFEYRQQFEHLHAALYRWDVWAAGYLIGGGCSDDAFVDFRAGLIAQGREWYERAAAHPDSLADHPEVIAAVLGGRDEALFDEPVNYAAAEAYARINGDGNDCAFYDDFDAFLGPRPDRERADMGEAFDFEDGAEMRARLPRLVSLHSWVQG